MVAVVVGMEKGVEAGKEAVRAAEVNAVAAAKVAVREEVGMEQVVLGLSVVSVTVDVKVELELKRLVTDLTC